MTAGRPLFTGTGRQEVSEYVWLDKKYKKYKDENKSIKSIKTAAKV